MRDLLPPPAEPASDELVARVRTRVLSGERPPRRSRAVVLALPTAVGIAVAFVVALSQLGGSQTPAFAAETVRAAEASPRLLVSGWTVQRVDEWQAGTGEMTFARGTATLELSWGPDVRTAGKDGEERVATTDVLGARAVVHRYAGYEDYTASWRDGTTRMAARAVAASPDEFLAILAAISRADAETWLRALPTSAVTPRESSAAVAGMLDGVPLPPGFKTPTSGGATRDRYQLGARVTGAVACGWIVSWIAAREAGDGDAVRAAQAALAGSRDWAILHEMNAEGDYPEVLWQYADAVNADDPEGGEIIGGKRGLTVEGTYKDAIGCP
jgi:hypothetical protein